MRASPPPEPPLAELFEQLVDEAGQLIKAEARIAEAKLTRRLRLAALPIGALVVAAVLALCALLAVLTALVVLIAPLIGLFFALVVVALLVAIAAFALYRWGRDELRDVFAMPAVRQDVQDLIR
jgi:Putative Actinobacterial Holin-X, holin superfamily III